MCHSKLNLNVLIIYNVEELKPQLANSFHGFCFFSDNLSQSFNLSLIHAFFL